MYYRDTDGHMQRQITPTSGMLTFDQESDAKREHDFRTPDKFLIEEVSKLREENQRLKEKLAEKEKANPDEHCLPPLAEDGVDAAPEAGDSKPKEIGEENEGTSWAESEHEACLNAEPLRNREPADAGLERGSEEGTRLSWNVLETADTTAGDFLSMESGSTSFSRRRFTLMPSSWTLGSANRSVVMGSAFSWSRPAQAAIFLIAFGGVVFVLAAKAAHLWDAHDEAHTEDHRRLGGGVVPLLGHIAFCILCAGMLAFLTNLIKQPLILGYLLGGMLAGPVGLNIVPDHTEIADLSSLGLIFLLFMVGLELNVKEVLKMGKVVIVTGLCQFPVCAISMFGVFMALNAIGISLGNGDFATLYVGVSCAISSTMIVVKLLSGMGDTDSQPGRLTIGILIFQDIWAIVVLAIQPKMDNPEILGVLLTFFKAADVTEVCARVPSFVNSLTLNFNDSDRHYLVQHVTYSTAGFYVGEVRLTGAAALKLVYTVGLVAFGILTKFASSM
mmetsp:Transcript_64608/g.179161  ORF Transcript_64608/g.179161 Transcript_64608/m.179161 type:complete len:502 (+) Transcript_64608:78-1583(+)